MKTLLLLGVLFLSGCTGASFQGAPDGAGDPEAGAGGELGGSGGEGASDTGGTPSQGGTAGLGAGAGGEATGGNETGGAPETGGTAAGGTDPIGGGGSAGSAGTSTGGGAGTGGATEPSCAPEEAIVFPESFNWDGFSARSDDANASYCGHSDGGVCTLRNISMAPGASNRSTFYAHFDCTADFFTGECGAEASCAGTFDDSPASIVFEWFAEGGGYRIDVVEQETRLLTSFNDEACRIDLGGGSYWSMTNEPDVDITHDFFALLEAEHFPCP